MALDKNEKKKRRVEYARLTKKIGRVLKRFTPIDESDEFSYGDDYDGALGSIVSLLLRGGTREELFEVLTEARRDFDVPPDSEKDLKITDAVLKAAVAKERPSRGKPKPAQIIFRLDLRDDYDAIQEHLASRVRDFEMGQCNGPGDTDLIHLIAVGYQCSQAGWVVVVFDARTNASMDGEWTRFIDGQTLERTRWVKADAANMRGPIALVDPEGRETIIAEESAELSEPIGEMIKSAVIHARSCGMFKDLPLAPGCTIWIEDFDGNYFWPDSETTSQPNLLHV